MTPFAVDVAAVGVASVLVAKAVDIVVGAAAKVPAIRKAVLDLSGYMVAVGSKSVPTSPAKDDSGYMVAVGATPTGTPAPTA